MNSEELTGEKGGGTSTEDFNEVRKETIGELRMHSDEMREEGRTVILPSEMSTESSGCWEVGIFRRERGCCEMGFFGRE